MWSIVGLIDLGIGIQLFWMELHSKRQDKHDLQAKQYCTVVIILTPFLLPSFPVWLCSGTDEKLDSMQMKTFGQSTQPSRVLKPLNCYKNHSHSTVYKEKTQTQFRSRSKHKAIAVLSYTMVCLDSAQTIMLSMSAFYQLQPVYPLRPTGEG